MKNTFLNLIPEWNGIDYFEILKIFIEIQDDENIDYFSIMLKKHLIRTLKADLFKTYVNENVLIIEGKPMIGKSQFFEWLVPSEYHTEDFVIEDRFDCQLEASRNLIIDIPDLKHYNKNQIQKLKDFISTDTFNMREPYQIESVEMKRKASFCCTTNETISDLNKIDETIFIQLKVESFNWEMYAMLINPLQLWSQCRHELRNDPSCGELTRLEKYIIQLR